MHLCCLVIWWSFAHTIQLPTLPIPPAILTHRASCISYNHVAPLACSEFQSQFLLMYFFSMVSKNLNLPLLFLWDLCMPYYFPMFLACQKMFWEMPSRKAQCVERFLVHLWPLLVSFDYRRNLGHTYSATFSRLDCWTWVDWGWFLVGRFEWSEVQLKSDPAKGREQAPSSWGYIGRAWFFASFETACLQWIYQTTGIQPC